MSVAILVVFFFRPDVFFRFFFVFLYIYNLLYKNVINSLKRKKKIGCLRTGYFSDWLPLNKLVT